MREFILSAVFLAGCLGSGDELALDGTSVEIIGVETEAPELETIRTDLIAKIRHQVFGVDEYLAIRFSLYPTQTQRSVTLPLREDETDEWIGVAAARCADASCSVIYADQSWVGASGTFSVSPIHFYLTDPEPAFVTDIDLHFEANTFLRDVRLSLASLEFRKD